MVVGVKLILTVTVLHLQYYVAMLKCYIFTVLYCYSVMLPFYSVIFLQCYVAMLQYYIVTVLYCYVTVHVTLVTVHCSVILLRAPKYSTGIGVKLILTTVLHELRLPLASHHQFTRRATLSFKY